MIYFKRILSQDLEKEMAFPKGPASVFFNYDCLNPDEPYRYYDFIFKTENPKYKALNKTKIENVRMRQHWEKKESKIKAELAYFLKKKLNAEVDDILVLQEMKKSSDAGNIRYYFDLIQKDQTELYEKIDSFMEETHEIFEDDEEEYNMERISIKLSFKPVEVKNTLKYNRIIFGAPGTGKSNKINDSSKEDFLADDIERITFHPNCSYSQFVGTYKPVSHGRISYEYVPGPFIRILREALKAEIVPEVTVNKLRLTLDSLQKVSKKITSETGLDAIEKIKKFIAEIDIEHFSTSKISKEIIDKLIDIDKVIDAIFNTTEENIAKATQTIKDLEKKDKEENSSEQEENQENEAKTNAPENTENKKLIKDAEKNLKEAEDIKFLINETKNKILELKDSVQETLNIINKRYLLIIEEINRANVAAVFGDMFQLLDREKTGESTYDINTSEDLKIYLSNYLNIDAASLNKIKIPNNMYIWATMNSADQGVFPMDAAFKRRWEFEYLPIDSEVIKEKFFDKYPKESRKNLLEKTDVYADYDCSKDKFDILKNNNQVFELEENIFNLLTWQVKCGNNELYNWYILRMAINKVLKLNVDWINEDKLLGPWFIKPDEKENIISAANFCSKVLMYLYEDVVKIDPSKIFKKGDKSIFYSDIKESWENGKLTFIDDVKNEYSNLIDGKE